MSPSRDFLRIRALKSAFIIALVTVLSSIASSNSVHAQYPVIIASPQPALPAVVGYAPERRGLFGQRVIMRPVVTPVTPVYNSVGVPSAPYPAEVSSMTIARPVVVARPNVSVPTVLSAPVLPPSVTPAAYSSFYAPSAVVPAAVTPVITVVPATPRTNVYIPPSWSY